MAPAKSGEKATCFALAWSLLSRYGRQNGAAAADLGLAIRGELSFLVEEKLNTRAAPYMSCLSVGTLTMSVEGRRQCLLRGEVVNWGAIHAKSCYFEHSMSGIMLNPFLV